MQQDLSMPLDLSAFACGHIQVSFAVVSQQGHSQFSPAQSICVEGGMYVYVYYVCVHVCLRVNQYIQGVTIYTCSAMLSGCLVHVKDSSLLENRMSNVFTS